MSPLGTADPGGLVARLAADASPTAGGVLVTGVWGAGVTRVLARAVRQLRAADRRVVHRVGTVDGLETADLVVVDDAHLLDEPAAAGLRDAVLDGEIAVLLGTRAGAHLPGPLQWLLASGAVTEVVLQLLDDTCMRLLAETALDGPAHPSLVHRLLAHSAGRMSFAADLLDEARSCGAVGFRNGLWRLIGEIEPTGPLLRRVASEVHALPAETARALELLAVAEGLTVPVARGLLEGELDAVIHRGLAGLDPSQRIVLAPPAAALAIRAALGPVAAAERAEQLLEHAAGSASASQLARWQILAGMELSGDAALAAAGAAFAEGDVGTALALTRGAAGSPAAAMLEVRLLQEIGRRADAAQRLRSVIADVTAPAGTRGAAGFELAQLLLWDLGEPDEAIRITEGVAASVEGTRLEALFRPARVATLLYSGDLGAAIALGEQGVVAGPESDAQLASALGVALALNGECSRGIELARLRLERDPTDLSRPDAAPDGVVSLLLCLAEGGELESAAEVAHDMYERARSGTRAAQAWMALCRLRVALHRGRLTEAAALGLEASVGFADLDQHATLRWAMAGRLLAAAQQGQAEQAGQLLRELDQLGPSGVRFLDCDVLRARAWGLASLGEHAAARAEMSRAGHTAAEGGAPTLAAHAWHDLLRLGGVDEAARQLTALRHVDSRWTRPRVQHARSLRQGDVDGLLRVAAAFDSLGASLLAAEATTQALGVAVERGLRADARRARTVLPDRLARCPDARTPVLSPQLLPSLTPRELEVAERARAGAASRAIAADLGVSVRTVDNLLQRAYVKLGISSRRELRARLPGPAFVD